MDRDITFSIVHKIVQDMRGRDSVGVPIEDVNMRDFASAQISMYESWREIISQELLKFGLTDEGYIRKSNEELRAMSLYDLLELREVYIRYKGEEENN